jgi:1,2-diacylglycerol 3-beta-galactosyltransferase
MAFAALLLATAAARSAVVIAPPTRGADAAGSLSRLRGGAAPLQLFTSVPSRSQALAAYLLAVNSRSRRMLRSLLWGRGSSQVARPIHPDRAAAPTDAKHNNVFGIPFGRRKKRVLILISDTGGGHRASAQALKAALEEQYNGMVETSIVDVWTAYGPWPYNGMVRHYRYLQRRPKIWYMAFMTSAINPTRYISDRLMSMMAYRGFSDCFSEFSPDLVVSMHPLCQTAALNVLDSAARGAARDAKKKVPFATVVTDLASPHPLWLHPRCDLCFVPSDIFARAAVQRGLCKSKLRQYGLPVRPAFAKQRRSAKELRRELGLLPGRKTVLLVGGGDGVGNLGAIVDAMGTRLGASNGCSAQMIVVCGKNKQLYDELRRRDWGGSLHVVVEGFVSRMADYMTSADCIVTKAGPGTIAEASICGLPIMLSGHLPGQESGNVRHVVRNGFGAYSRDPNVIAKTVWSWFQDPAKLARMSEQARKHSKPHATKQIAEDIVRLLERSQPAPDSHGELAGLAALTV